LSTWRTWLGLGSIYLRRSLITAYCYAKIKVSILSFETKQGVPTSALLRCIGFASGLPESLQLLVSACPVLSACRWHRLSPDVMCIGCLTVSQPTPLETTPHVFVPFCFQKFAGVSPVGLSEQSCALSGPRRRKRVSIYENRPLHSLRTEAIYRQTSSWANNRCARSTGSSKAHNAVGFRASG
jgi:hypothetical protein